MRTQQRVDRGRPALGITFSSLWLRLRDRRARNAARHAEVVVQSRGHLRLKRASSRASKPRTVCAQPQPSATRRILADSSSDLTSAARRPPPLTQQHSRRASILPTPRIAGLRMRIARMAAEPHREDLSLNQASHRARTLVHPPGLLLAPRRLSYERVGLLECSLSIQAGLG